MQFSNEVDAVANRTYIVNERLHTAMTPDEIDARLPESVVEMLVAQWHARHAKDE